MLRIKDIIISTLLIILYLASGIFFFVINKPFLVFVSFLGFVFLKILQRRKKRIAKYLKTEFKELGYEIISEEPLKLFDNDIKIEPTIMINGVPFERFRQIVKYNRNFISRDLTDKKLYSLKTTVRLMWNRKIKVEITEKKAFANIGYN